MRHGAARAPEGRRLSRPNAHVYRSLATVEAAALLANRADVARRLEAVGLALAAQTGTVIFMIAGKLDFSRINPYVAA